MENLTVENNRVTLSFALLEADTEVKLVYYLSGCKAGKLNIVGLHGDPMDDEDFSYLAKQIVMFLGVVCSIKNNGGACGEWESEVLLNAECVADDIKKEYFVLLNELKQYNPELLDKKIILAVTKSDLIDDELQAEMERDLPDVPCVFISSVAQKGLTELKDLIWKNIIG